MLLGGLLWGYVIASLVEVFSRWHPDASVFTKTMGDLNRFVHLYALPTEMRQRLREYFLQTQHLRSTLAHRNLLAMMSPSLQSEVMFAAHGRALSQIEFLRDAPAAFLAELAVVLEAQVFAPGELAPSGFMYIVQKGVALFGGRVLTRGRSWGHDVIVTDESLRSDLGARAMNYLEVHRIAGGTLLEIAGHFPVMHHHMRWCAIRMALQRYMIRATSGATPRSFNISAIPKAGWDRLSRVSQPTHDDISRASAQGRSQLRRLSNVFPELSESSQPRRLASATPELSEASKLSTAQPTSASPVMSDTITLDAKPVQEVIQQHGEQLRILHMRHEELHAQQKQILSAVSEMNALLRSSLERTATLERSA